MDQADSYKDRVLAYLGQKYQDRFVVKRMFLACDWGDENVVFATCFSKTYPYIRFKVAYHLGYAAWQEEELQKMLREAGRPLPEKREDAPPRTEEYFEDSYTPILYQNRFDLALRKQNPGREYFVRTVFRATNYCHTLEESRVTLDAFVNNPNCRLYSYHYIFAKNSHEVEENLERALAIAKEVFYPGIYQQNLQIYFVKSYSPQMLDEEFCQNYAQMHSYFEESLNVKRKCYLTYRDGALRESKEAIRAELERG